MINFLMNSVLGGAWSLAKNTYRGARGTTKKTVDGVEVATSSYSKLAKDIREKTDIIGRGGRKVDKHGNVIEADLFDRMGNIANAGLGVVSDATLGSLGQGLGWMIGGVGKAMFGSNSRGLMYDVATQTARGTGLVANHTIKMVGDTAIDAASTAYHLSKSPYGRGMLLAAPMGIMAAPTIFKEATGGAAIDDAIQFSMMTGGLNVESIAGSVTAPVPRRRPDNFGADGDLVFALHNLR